MENKFNCILLIDDDNATNEIHKYVIKRSNVAEKVHTVSSGYDALDYLTNSGEYESDSEEYPQPDIIFLDINMPAMNGFEFMEEYEKLKRNQQGDIVIVMLTASLNPDDKERALSIEQINDFHSKPLTVEKLHELAAALLN